MFHFFSAIRKAYVTIVAQKNVNCTLRHFCFIFSKCINELIRMKWSLILFDDFCLFVDLFKLPFYIAKKKQKKKNTFYYIRPNKK